MKNSIQLPENNQSIILETGDIITLKADNGKYLSRVEYVGVKQAIEATKDSVDIYCKFEVLVHKDLKISLKADNKAWLSRITRGSDEEPIEAIKMDSSDITTQFKVMQLSNTNGEFFIALQADNFRWISRIDRQTERGKQTIEAARVKTGIDVHCMFKIEKLR
ncbi:hypothetical protein [Flavobacterium sp. J27]|uniref:fascin domain-containing protein n=1 Tax=Flavobacterium sp. J27 TaxID=2060419 RepID=UPI00103004AE|nr:hypothetical protein [Flavobacterium sp. J27]